MKTQTDPLARSRRAARILTLFVAGAGVWAGGPGMRLLASDTGPVQPSPGDPLFPVRVLASHGFPAGALGMGSERPVILGDTLFFAPRLGGNESIGLWKVSLTGPSQPVPVGEMRFSAQETVLAGKLGNRAYAWNSGGQFFSWAEDSSAPRREPFQLPPLPDGAAYVNRQPFLFERDGRAYFVVRAVGGDGLPTATLWSTDGAALYEVLPLLPDAAEPPAALNGDVIVTHTSDFMETDTIGWLKPGPPAETGAHLQGLEEAAGSTLREARSVNGRLLFQRGTDMVAVSGAEPGAVTVAETMGQAFNRFMRGTVVMGDHLYFQRGSRLWKTDGTPAGTTRVSGSVELTPDLAMHAANGAVYFSHQDISGEFNLYRSDGTARGTALLKRRARVLVAGESLLYLEVTSGAAPNRVIEFHVTDGTAAGTRLLATGRTDYIRTAGNHALFRIGGVMWLSDGTPEGTRRLFPASQSGAPFMESGIPPVVSGSTVFLGAGERGADLGLWAADAAAGGVRPLLMLPATGPRVITPFGDGAVLFFVRPASGGWRLMRAGSTAESVTLLTQVEDNPQSLTGTQPPELSVAGGHAWFFAPRAPRGSGITLFRTDGTPEGTVAVKSGFSLTELPASLAAHGTGAYFSAYVPLPEGEGTALHLWHSDGTEAGTLPIPGPIPLAPEITTPLILTSGTRVFIQSGADIHAGDGTPPADFQAVGDGVMLTAAEGKVYFIPAAGDTPLAVSDGTPGGLVRAGLPDTFDGTPPRAPRVVVTGGVAYLQAGHVPFPDSPVETMRLDAFDADTLAPLPLSEAREWDRTVNPGYYSLITPVAGGVAYWHRRDSTVPYVLYVAGKSGSVEVPGALIGGAAARFSELASDGKSLFYVTTSATGQELRAVDVGSGETGASLRVTADPVEGGAVTGGADGVQEPGMYPVSAVPAAGYYFSHWEGRGIARPLDAGTGVAVDSGGVWEVRAVFTRAPRDYADWASAAGLTPAEADPRGSLTGDGTANLLKHAFHLDPKKPAAALHSPDPAAGLPLITVEVNNGISYLRYEYVRRRWTRLAYAAERSAGGAAWTAAAAAPVVTPLDGDRERVVITQPLPAGTARAFGRVRVTLD